MSELSFRNTEKMLAALQQKFVMWKNNSNLNLQNTATSLINM